MLTRQEIFDTAYIGLRNQNFEHSIAGGQCVYRSSGPFVNKCAFGHLIPDNQYSPELEGRSADALLSGEVITTWRKRIEDSSPNEVIRLEALNKALSTFIDFKVWTNTVFSGDDRIFIRELQIAHDTTVGSAELMQTKLMAFAKKYDLTIPE